MTFPIFSLTCERCGHVERGGSTSGHRYALPDGETLGIPTQLAWCRDCKKFESVEDLDPRRWLEEVTFVRDRLASARLEKRLLGTRWTFDGMVYEWSIGPRSAITPENVTNWVQHLDEALAGIDALRARKAPARCLSCGGCQFDLVEHRTDPTDPERTVMIHPGCGGIVRSACEGDIYISGERAVRQYTLEGEFIGWFKEGKPYDAT